MQDLACDALIPEEVGPPASAPVMAPEALMTAIFFLPKGPVNVLGLSLAYFFRVTCSFIAQINMEKYMPMPCNF